MGQGGGSYVRGEQGWDSGERGAGMGQGGGSYVSGEQGWDREGAAM